MEGMSEGTMAAVRGHDCGANMSLSLSSSRLTVVQLSTLLKNDEFQVISQSLLFAVTIISLHPLTMFGFGS